MQQCGVRRPLLPPAVRSVGKDERGLTLIELLTGLMLFGMITAILYSFLFMGASMYRKISVETQLRNQADALYGLIVTELKDAVYVKQGKDSQEIVYVKRSADPKVYVDTYRMAIEREGENGPYGLSVYGPDGTLVRRFDLASRFVLKVGDPGMSSGLIAMQQNMVKILLVFDRADADRVPAAERSVMRLESTIPLFRME
ncbi:MAG TPA: prepilin-type N-terminal cleavage/methylation domain-containing protein [Paenibacillaceae bacterium]